MKIHCSGECKKNLDLLGGYETIERGYVAMKVSFTLVDNKEIVAKVVTIFKFNLGKRRKAHLLAIERGFELSSGANQT
jgi:hypothetical protein